MTQVDDKTFSVFEHSFKPKREKSILSFVMTFLIFLLVFLGSRKNSIATGDVEKSVSKNPGDFENFPEIHETSVTNL